MKKEQQDFYIRIGLMVASYFLVVKPVLVWFGFQKTTEEKKIEKEREKALLSEEEKLSRIQKSTKTDAEWQIIADALYRDMRFTRWTGADNIPDAIRKANTVEKNIDWIKLYNRFGRRQEYHFGIENGPPMDLVQFIQANLWESEINFLNNEYAKKNIKYRY